MPDIGPLIIDLHGQKLSEEEREIITHPLVGGVILFARNYDTPKQIENLCREMRALSRGPLLIMVDQEGGRVQRFIEGFTRLPFMALFGEMYDHDPDFAACLAKNCGWLMATELLSVGIDLSLAPVLDLNKGKNTVIGDRAFHEGPPIVSTLSGAFIKGMQEAGMAATGKHFPGHGSVSADSHLVLPQDDRSLANIESEDMLPFIYAIKNNISALMPAHIIFPKVDNHPVSFSRIWLKDILRVRLGHKGAIFSDDLNMEGANISEDYADRMLAARDAGCDFTLLCNNRKGVIQVLDRGACFSHRVSNGKWYTLQGDFSRNKHSHSENERWKKTREWLTSLVNNMRVR
jgi:beta-N-acetylhexosaminidase